MTLATQLNEVFYRVLVPFRPSFISPNIQRIAEHFPRVYIEEHPKNLTSQWWRTRASFFVPWLRRQKNQARKGTFNWGNSLGRDLFSEYCFLHLSFVPTCEIIFVRKYQLFIHEDCQHPVFIHELLTFIVCLNTLPFYWGKEKRKKPCYFTVAKQKKKDIYSSLMKKSTSKGTYNLRQRIRAISGSSQKKSTTIEQNYCDQCFRVGNENQV